jgi:phosphoglycolate phosphatase-like HAD superfamily hydrolase
MIKAIIFDFDGVLVESIEIKTKAFEEIFKNETVNTRKKIIDYHLAHGSTSRFEKLKFIYANILNREMSNETYIHLCEVFSELVIDKVVNTQYVDGAKEFLDGYSGHYECFVVSGTPEEEIKEIIHRRGMDRYFKNIFGAPKEKQKVVKDILDQYNYLPNDTVYVGDAILDYRAAKINSIHFIARTKDSENLFAGIDCIKVSDLTNLKNILDSIDG